MRSFQNILARVLNRLTVLDKVNLTVPLEFNGSQLKIPVINRIGFDHLYINKDYDFNVYNFFKDKMRAGVFMDVGANRGQTLLKILSIIPQHPVVCIEPSASCVNYLETLKSVNGFRSVTIVPAAIFDKNGIQKLYGAEVGDTGATLNPAGRQGQSFVLVNAIVGSELRAIQKEKFSFIKIDVEGEELAVLQTLRDVITSDQPVIYCEVLDAGGDADIPNNDQKKQRLRNFLTEINYKVCRLDERTNGLVDVDSFPSRAYRPENLDSCNYIFTKR
ncbi:MAG TPA: FkbM family methyltransferase [Cyclobacteriaceae bacterium]|nr:FkbM family methyltransferase [Cyclobacteriaceae bacterium]